MSPAELGNWLRAAPWALLEQARPHLRALFQKEGSPRPAFWWLDAHSGRTREGPLHPGDGAWIPVAEESWHPKQASDGQGALRSLTDILQLTPHSFNAPVGGPTPLAAMLAGGLLGGGLGYAGGRLVEHAFGDDVLEPGKLSRMGMLLGGTAGMVPGAYLGSVGHRQKSREGQSPWSAWVEPNVLFGKESSHLRELQEELEEELQKEYPTLMAPGWLKKAELVDGAGLLARTIPTDAFGRTILEDPFTPLALRAATVGLLQTAETASGSPLVSPFEVGRIAAGMGSGLLAGMFVGKVLGALAGLTPGAQSTLQQTGMWAGALKAVVPMAFGAGS